MVEDRRIRCAKRTGHGSETFVQGIENSCNPVFIDVAMRMGVDAYCDYFKKFGLMEKTGIDLPGEAGTISAQKRKYRSGGACYDGFWTVFSDYPGTAGNYGGISDQRGGERIVPHFGVEVRDRDGVLIQTCDYGKRKRILSEETSEKMRYAWK